MPEKKQSEPQTQAWEPNPITTARRAPKSRSTRCYTAALCVFVTASHTAPAKPIDLAPKFVKGQKVRYVSVSRILHTIQVELADINERVNVRTETGMTLAVGAVDSNGVAELAWVVNYLSLEADGRIPGIADALEYDSRKPGPSASPLAAVLDRLVEHPAYARVDPKGNILDFRGPTPPTGSGPLDALAQSFFSREAFAQLPFFITDRARRPARIRSTWKRKTKIQMPLGVGALEITQSFAFQRISPRRKTAHLRMNGRIGKALAKSATGAAPGMPDPASALVVERGQLEGQYLWDFDAGQLQSAETHLELSTSLTTPLGPMKLTQDMNTIIRRQPNRNGQEAGDQKPDRRHRQTPRKTELRP